MGNCLTVRATNPNPATGRTSSPTAHFPRGSCPFSQATFSSAFIINRSIIFGQSSTTSDPVRPATRPALRAGQVGRPCRVPSKYPAPQSFGLLSHEPQRIFGGLLLCNPKGLALVNEPHQTTMPAPGEAVLSRMLPPAGTQRRSRRKRAGAPPRKRCLQLAWKSVKKGATGDKLSPVPEKNRWRT
jgi:hypothetical protein